MENVNVTLPGGKVIEVSRGTPIADLLASCGGNKGAIAARFDGRPVDLQRAIDAGGVLEWITADSADGLDILRHSTAHRVYFPAPRSPSARPSKTASTTTSSGSSLSRRKTWNKSKNACKNW
jgi:sulfur carrier protein ThiS